MMDASDSVHDVARENHEGSERDPSTRDRAQHPGKHAHVQHSVYSETKNPGTITALRGAWIVRFMAGTCGLVYGASAPHATKRYRILQKRFQVEEQSV